MIPDDHTEEGTFRVAAGGAEYLVPRYCPHRAGRMAHGHVNPQRRTISCPLHYSVFDLETGEQLSGPPCGPLAVAKCPGGNGPSAA